MAGNPSAGGKSESSGLPLPGLCDSVEGSCVESGLARPRGSKTLCIPGEPKRSAELVKDEKRFRRSVDELYAQHPELFPEAMSEGYQCHDTRPPSVKLGLRLRRIKLLATGELYSVCPSLCHARPGRLSGRCGQGPVPTGFGCALLGLEVCLWPR